jgi:molybdopterin synthase sulfur carrier subunit
MSIRIRVSYFAILREERGLSEEQIATDSQTAAELYDELCERHRFSMPSSRLRVAINDAFAPWTSPIKEGDGLVFIPPVAGG